MRHTNTILLASLLGVTSVFNMAAANTIIRYKTPANTHEVKSEQIKKDISSAFKKFFLDIKDSAIIVSNTDFPHLYEVNIDNQHIFYTNKTGDFIITGDVFDTKKNINIKQQRLKTLKTIDFNSLPLENALKIVQGKGERVLVSFEDPNCFYCKKFHKEVSQVKNLTHYIFLIPLLSKESEKVITHIWCSKDPVKSWDDLMSKRIKPKDNSNCKTPIQENKQIAKEIGMTGTPTLIFQDGSQVGGMLPAERLEEILSK
ncbi:MAG: DsbC family protein [Alcaligenaceae bacterium]|nr:DsbC family protein [Alcaligenaceae bacterium]